MTWQTVKVCDLGQVVTGDTPPKNRPEYYGSAYPFIKPTDMQIGHRYTYSYEESYSEEAFEKYRKKLIPSGATAVVTIGSIGQNLH
jgi:type I restriction enzyme S subunit